MNPLHALLLTDLSMELPIAVRLQRMVELLRMHFGCGAVALLGLDKETSSLRPVAVEGLSRDALGRRFPIADHPRLATLLKRAGEVVRFAHDSSLPDPYDGLVIEQAGQPLDVHDCMGVTLEVEGQCWGVLTLDALTVGTFAGKAVRDLEQLVPLIEAAVRVTRLETALRGARQSAGTVAESLVARPEGEIIGDSPPLQRLLKELQVVADTELPVLLLGGEGEAVAVDEVIGLAPQGRVERIAGVRYLVASTGRYRLLEPGATSPDAEAVLRQALPRDLREVLTATLTMRIATMIARNTCHEARPMANSDVAVT